MGFIMSPEVGYQGSRHAKLNVCFEIRIVVSVHLRCLSLVTIFEDKSAE
jgi:hypothetical protein